MVVWEVLKAASVIPDKERIGNAWLNVEVTVNTAGVIAEPDDPRTYSFLLPTRSVNQPNLRRQCST